MNAPRVEIVKLGPRDGQMLKAIRLEALRREPAAFSSSYPDAVDRPDEHWRDRLANPKSVTYVARIQDRPIGMAGVIFGADGEDHVAMLFGMYVSATFRGQGVGRMLLDTLVGHVATRPEITTIRLWVTPTQQAARQLYASLGFQNVENPDRSTLDGPGAQEEIAMERAVTGRDS